MADDEKRHDHKKQTAKSKGKIKSRWRKPGNILNMGNREKGESFPFKLVRLKLKIFAFVNQTFTWSMCLLTMYL